MPTTSLFSYLEGLVLSLRRVPGQTLRDSTLRMLVIGYFGEAISSEGVVAVSF